MPGPEVFPGMGGDGKRRWEGLAVGEGFIPPGMFVASGGFRGVGDAAPYVGGRPLMGGCASLQRGVWAPRPTDAIHVSTVGAAYMPPEGRAPVDGSVRREGS